jgi:ribosomal protein S18 acetylase RimI-like enzyme
MEIKLASKDDINEIIRIIKDAIQDMDSEGIHQWDNVYPNEEIVLHDIHEGTIYVLMDNKQVRGFLTLNEDYEEEYNTINWRYRDGKNLIIHRLCVDPKFQGNGIARALIYFAERFGIENKYTSIRLDSFISNHRACKLYEKNGYEVRGSVTFRKGKFLCFEKKIL